jgi:hypothetical protein
MSDTPANTSNTNEPSTASGKRPHNPNWGGARPNAGRKKQKLPAVTVTNPTAADQGSQAAPSPQVRRVGQSATASTSAPSTAPATGFFARRMHNNPTAVQTNSTTDMQTENTAADSGLSGTMLGQNSAEFNSSSVLQRQQGLLSHKFIL